MRPHEQANALRNARLARHRYLGLLILMFAAFGMFWLGLGYFGGELLRWAVPR